jgi:hypothetical protein
MKGFYAARYVLAHNPEDAVERAFAKIRRKLGARNADVRDVLISITFEADEVGAFSMVEYLTTLEPRPRILR